MSPAASARNWIVLTGLLAALPVGAFAQGNYTTDGGEYELSGALPGEQTAPAASVNASGGWLVWQDNAIDGKGYGIGARRIDNALAPVGGAIRVNLANTGDQERPRVALLNSGGAAVVWQGGKLGFQDIFLRILNADGSFATKDVLVNPANGKHTWRETRIATVYRNNRAQEKTQRLKHSMSLRHERTGNASVAALQDGTILVAYTGSRKVDSTLQVLETRVRQKGSKSITNTVPVKVRTLEDSMQDIYLQRFDAAGQKVGPEVRANQVTAHNQFSPSVAVLPNGTFVVAWASDRPEQQVTTRVNGSLETISVGTPYVQIVARVFDGSGNPLGDEFVVNVAERPCANPSVAPASPGGFTVAWTQKDSIRQNSLDIYARCYDANSAAMTTAFRVNEHSVGDQHSAQVAATPSGQLVVWTSLRQDGSYEGVYGRWLKDGTISSGEFRVNTTTHLRQFQPAVAADGGNRAVVIWSSYQTEAAFDLFGQRYTAQ